MLTQTKTLKIAGGVTFVTAMAVLTYVLGEATLVETVSSDSSQIAAAATGNAGP